MVQAGTGGSGGTVAVAGIERAAVAVAEIEPGPSASFQIRAKPR